jgi:hypothetical protein
MAAFTIHDVVQQIVILWHSRLEVLPQYIEQTFGISISEPYEYEQLIILQQEFGDIDRGLMAGDTIANWLYEDESLSFCTETLHWKRGQQRDSTGLWITPFYSFFLQDTNIVITEKLGSQCTHRLKGKIRENHSLRIEWKTVWHWHVDPTKGHKKNYL